MECVYHKPNFKGMTGITACDQTLPVGKSLDSPAHSEEAYKSVRPS